MSDGHVSTTCTDVMIWLVLHSLTASVEAMKARLHAFQQSGLVRIR